jgi:hypothetical protein
LGPAAAIPKDQHEQQYQYQLAIVLNRQPPKTGKLSIFNPQCNESSKTFLLEQIRLFFVLLLSTHPNRDGLP